MVATMTNVRDNSLFNPEMKQNFLKSMVDRNVISLTTSKSYERVLVMISGNEKALNKDIAYFNFKELETVLYDFQANNRNTVESYARIISSYLNWAVSENLIERNYLYDLKPNDFEKYLTNNEKYFTEHQLRRWEDDCENYQDAVIIRLLFMGAGGKQMSEIRNLKADDEHIDRDNMRLKLVNTLKTDKNGLPEKFSVRYLDIDERTLALIDGAIKQTIYTKKNGEMKHNPHVRPYTELVKNDYVLRASVTRTENWNIPLDKYVIYRRVDVLSKSLQVEELTAKYIQRSGMIHYAKELIGDGELSLDDMKIIADKFNIKSYHNLKGFLTTENIQKTFQQK